MTARTLATMTTAVASIRSLVVSHVTKNAPKGANSIVGFSQAGAFEALASWGVREEGGR